MSAVMFEESGAERIVRSVKWTEAHAGEAWARAAAPIIAPQDQAYCRVTSATVDGNGDYPAVRTVPDASAGTWTDYSAVKLRPLNGETLENAKRYAARGIGLNASDEEVYVVLERVVPSSAPTVERVDGTLSVVGASVIKFDQSDGLIVTNPSGTIVRIDISAASGTDVGIVTTTTQTFAGNKSILGTLTVVPPGGTPLYVSPAGVDGFTLNDPTDSGRFVVDQTAFGWEMAGYYGNNRVIAAFEPTLGAMTFTCVSSIGALSGAGVWGGSFSIFDGTTQTAGGSAVTGGLTFEGGLYISGTATATTPSAATLLKYGGL